MTSRPEQPSQHSKLQWHSVKTNESNSICTAYADTTTPLNLLVLPDTSFTPANPPTTPVVAVFERLQLDDQQLSRTKRIGEAFNRMSEFAHKHPWLTTSMMVALLFFLVTSYLTASALMGHTTIAIFHAHPEVGAGLAFMTFYYGVYLVNMARRAVIKDDLEKRIESHNKFKDNLVATRTHAIQDLVQCNTGEDRVRSAIQEQYDQANAVLNRLKEYQTQLSKLLMKNLDDKHRALAHQAFERVSSAIQQGGGCLVPAKLQLPSLPTVAMLPEHIKIPDRTTETMEENVLKARSMKIKFKSFFKNTAQFVKQNPGSATLIVAGLAMCILGGVAISFWLHGMIDIYFIGSLSAMTIAPMLIYGLSLVYEGYNSGTINDLEQKLRQIDEADESHKRALEEERTRLDIIFSQVRTEQQESHQIELAKALKSKEVSQWHETAGHCEALLELFSTIYPNIDLIEARRVVEEPARGAEILTSS